MKVRPPYERRRHRMGLDLAGQAPREVIYGCLSKIRYPDEAVARAATAHHLEHGSSEAVELWVHRCPHCRGWHTTKRPQPGEASVVADDPFKVRRR